MDSFRAPLLSIAFIAIVFLVIALPGALAIEALESQQDITLTIERDSSYTFPLVLKDVQEKRTVSSTGDIADWVGFWNDDEPEYDVYPGQSYLLVTIDVPDDAELEEYEGEIHADGSVISKITVKVTLELSDVKAYDKLSDVDKEVGSLKDNVGSLTTSISELRSQVATLEHEVSEKVKQIYDYQKNLNELDKENDRLSEDLSELEAKFEESEESNEELNELTGMLVGTQLPGMFIGGVILGVIFVSLLVNREIVKRKVKHKIKKAVRRTPKADAPEKKDKSFKYSFSGK